MADIAHDAPGPASPKPGDIGPQQASRPDLTDRGKLRVFISYSRDDLYFADQLGDALNACGFECVIDRHGISGGEDWKRRLGNLISEADTVVFVLSPTSARSEICDWEVEEATRLGKRILPIICRPLEGASPPPRLRERNYIFFYDDPKAAPDSGFGTGLAKLVAALNTDFEWLREHTRYLQRATEWDRGGRPANRLLLGGDIAQARAWAAHRPKNAPEPIALHLDFIRASEVEAESQLSARRKQLEEVAAAQTERERALRQAEEAQRKRATMAKIRNMALAAVSILALLAGWLYWRAEDQTQQADDILASATDIIVQLQNYFDDTTKKQVFRLFKRGADHGDKTSMRNLAATYRHGQGVAQDYAKANEWSKKAADKGETRAMNELGEAYLNGEGVPPDHKKALAWFKKAADKGETKAMFNLGLLYGYGDAKDYAKAREWFEKAADRGDASGLFGIGGLYEDAKYYTKALEWYERAADKGDAAAMRGLGVFYLKGQGVTQDYSKAREWFKKAADNRNVSAMDFLAQFYAEGVSVAKDYGKAREWYQKAADNSEFAKVQLPIMEAVIAGRYAEALQRQEAFAATSEVAENLASALRDVARYALFAREFSKALTAAERAHTLLPDDLAIETNRAHALMFKEREKEAKALYLAYKGKPLWDGQLWEQVIVEDFAEFRRAGLTNPMMADIEKELGVSP
jgi:TPR repeat protein